MLSILLVVLLATGLVGSVHAANYFLDNFDVDTITQGVQSPSIRFRFQIRDYEDYGTRVMDNVIQTVTITDPDNNLLPDLPVPPVRHIRRLTDWVSTDKNGDGNIDPYSGEFENKYYDTYEYRIYYLEPPHIAGIYKLKVQCTNGQELLIDSEHLATGVILPQVTDVTTAFDTDGRLMVSWTPNQTYPYPTDTQLEVRVTPYGIDGGNLHHRMRARKLPMKNIPMLPNGKQYHKFIFKEMSDILREIYPYIAVRVQTSSGPNRAEPSPKTYRIDGSNLTPATIPVPSLLSEEEVDALVAETCPGNSENPSRPESPGKSNPPGLNK